MALGNSTVRALGNIGDETVILAIDPVALSGVTPVLSAAIALDGSVAARNRKRIVILGHISAATKGATMTVTESATSGGSYAAPAAGNVIDSGAVADATAGIQTIEYVRNPAKPFIKVTWTGDDATTSGLVSAEVLFL